MQFASNLRENGASRAAKRSLQTRTRPLHRPRKTTGTIKSPEAPRSCPQISPRNVLPRRLLGLPIVLEIASKHDAEVRLEDAHPGQNPPGARFSVRFAASEGMAGG